MMIRYVLALALAVGLGRAQADELRGFLGKDAVAPTGAALERHLASLGDLLGNPDPKLRDDVGYALLARWIVRDGAVPDDQLRALLARWQPQLAVDGADDEAVLRRSFSALALSLLVARDNQQPFLDKAAFDELLAAALRYLRDETDTRGYHEQLGWIHSVAHTADLLKFLSRSRHLAPAQQRQVLDAIRDKLAAVRRTFSAGEDGRLMRAVLAVIDRDDFDAASYREWVRTLLQPSEFASPTHRIAFGQNRLHVVTGLFAQLALDREPSPGRKQALAATRLLLGG
ncbi:MAG: DUF2785 domain-containing protein [Planctomycetes bacterium]|nr:DUF2785 domain-containing protein [Planctomycetota bacterium]